METLLMKIAIIAILIIGVYFIYKYKEKYKLILNEFFWLFASWIICLILYFFSGIKYTFNLNMISFIYIFLVLGAFCGGYYISSKYIKINFKKQNQNETENYIKKINLIPLFIVALICVIIYTIYIIATNNIIIGVTREIKTNAFSTFMLLISSSSLIIWLYEFSYSILNKTKISFYGLISILIFNLPGIIISGRDALSIFLISTFIIYIYCSNKTKNELSGVEKRKYYKKIIIFLIIAILLILVYLFVLSNNRYGSNKDSAINMFKFSAGCEFPQYLETIYEYTGSFGKLINNVIFYYSSQISKFAFIFENYDGPYMFGFYQLHYISRMLPESLNLNYTLVSNELATLTNNVGIPGLKVLWETAIGYSIYDFGRIGTLFISFIGGILIGIINKWYKNNRDIMKLLAKTFICTAMFLTVEISPLFDYFYIFPVLWIVIIYIVENIKEKRKETNE